MDQNLSSWGLPLGRIAGIRIRIHWLLLLFWLYELHQLWELELRGPRLIAFWAVGTGVIFLTILLHELGHCFAARRVGGGADEILLWPLGGLALVRAPNTWRAQLAVALGGPAVNVLIAAIAYPLVLLLEHSASGLFESRYVRYAAFLLTRINLILLIFNLIPLYPLDGGRAFQALAWGYLIRRRGHGAGAYGRSMLATLWASRITAILGLAYAVYAMSTFLLLIFIWAWSGAESIKRRIQEADADGFLGHDFSRGYTSLEGGAPEASARGKRRGSFLSRLLGSEQRARRKAAEDARRLDELLEKISREGMDALTRGEQRFLETMSRRRGRR